jgi:hypothetical protein
MKLSDVEKLSQKEQFALLKFLEKYASKTTRNKLKEINKSLGNVFFKERPKVCGNCTYVKECLNNLYRFAPTACKKDCNTCEYQFSKQCRESETFIREYACVYSRANCNGCIYTKNNQCQIHSIECINAMIKHMKRMPGIEMPDVVIDENTEIQDEVTFLEPTEVIDSPDSPEDIKRIAEEFAGEFETKEVVISE